MQPHRWSGTSSDRDAAYLHHEGADRFVQSNHELEVANILYQNETPFFSGCDPECRVDQDTMRSDDFVLPRQPPYRDVEVRVEVAGLWYSHPRGEPGILQYRRAKQIRVEECESSDDFEYILLLPDRWGNSRLEEWRNQLRPFFGGSNEYEMPDATPPTSFYNGRNSMIEQAHRYIPRGEVITTTRISQERCLGPTFLLSIYRWFDNSIDNFAESAGYELSRRARYGMTRDEALEYIQIFLEQEYGEDSEYAERLAPSDILRDNGHGFIPTWAARYFGGMSNLRVVLGQEAYRNPPFTREIVSDYILSEAQDGLTPISSSLDQNIYQWIVRNSRDEETPQEYMARITGLQLRPQRSTREALIGDELVEYLRINSSNLLLPTISSLPNYVASGLRRTRTEREWTSLSLPAVARRLTNLDFIQDKRGSGRMESIIDELAFTVYIHGVEEVMSWNPQDMKSNRDRMLIHLERLSDSGDYPSPYTLWFDIRRIQWDDRRYGGKFRKNLDYWENWCREVQVRINAGETIRSASHNSLYQVFLSHHRQRANSFRDAISLAQTVRVREWYLQDPRIDEIWEDNEYFLTFNET
jgi:hypothetical protein